MTTITAELSLDVRQELSIKASPDKAFAALLERLGPANTTPDGQSLNLTLEARPGGRWFRDLGNDEGHLWGHVQVLKRPRILEVVGPLFMSYPALSHVQFKIEEDGNGSRLTFRHQAIGPIDPAHLEGVKHGWNHMLEGIKTHAEHN